MRRAPLFALVGAVVLAGSSAGASTPSPPATPEVRLVEQVRLELLEGFMSALALEDGDRASRATLPFVHPSLRNASGDDLADDVKRFSFKKARSNVASYPRPLRVVRVAQTPITTVGPPHKGAEGAVVDYYLLRTGAAPAPIRVFFPRDGGRPTVAYMGSL